MKSNFQQFAAIGRPWVADGDYVREEQDAANPMCSTARRRSARDYVEIRGEQKSHNMCFSEPKPKIEKSQSQSARVLSIRNRLASHEPEKAALADWQVESRVYVESPAKREAAAKRETGPVSKGGVDRKWLSLFRRVMNNGLRTHIIFTHYSDVVRHYGSVEAYLETK